MSTHREGRAHTDHELLEVVHVRSTELLNQPVTSSILEPSQGSFQPAQAMAALLGSSRTEK